VLLQLLLKCIPFSSETYVWIGNIYYPILRIPIILAFGVSAAIVAIKVFGDTKLYFELILGATLGYLMTRFDIWLSEVQQSINIELLTMLEFSLFILGLFIVNFAAIKEEVE